YLDAPVQKYVPGYPEKNYPITSRQIAAHLGGVPALPQRLPATHCARPDAAHAPAPRMAVPYVRGWLSILSEAPPGDNSCQWGAGGFVSTAEDLARFGLALLRGDLVKRESLSILLSPQKTTSG